MLRYHILTHALDSQRLNLPSGRINQAGALSRERGHGRRKEERKEGSRLKILRESWAWLARREPSRTRECNRAGQAMPGSESDEDIDEAALLEALEEADSDDDDVRAPGSRQGGVHARRCLETMGDDLVLRIMGLLRCLCLLCDGARRQLTRSTRVMTRMFVQRDAAVHVVRRFAVGAAQCEPRQPVEGAVL